MGNLHWQTVLTANNVFGAHFDGAPRNQRNQKLRHGHVDFVVGIAAWKNGKIVVPVAQSVFNLVGVFHKKKCMRLHFEIRLFPYLYIGVVLNFLSFSF